MRVISRRDRSIRSPSAGDPVSTTPSTPPVPRGSYLVVGLGRAGSAAADALIAMPDAVRVLAWDGSHAGPARQVARGLRRHGVKVWLGGDGIAALEAAGSGAIVIKSPGIYFDVPILERARSLGLQVLDELELGWRLSERPIVGVTGTNGKFDDGEADCGGVGGGRPPPSAGRQHRVRTAAVGSDRGGLDRVRGVELSAGGCPVVSPGRRRLYQPDLRAPGEAREHEALCGGQAGNVRSRRPQRADGDRQRSTTGSGEAWPGMSPSPGERFSATGLTHARTFTSSGQSGTCARLVLSLRTPDGRVECTTSCPGVITRQPRRRFRHGACSRSAGGSARQQSGGIDGPPGRWEVITELESFDVIVDFAHNPDGISRRSRRHGRWPMPAAARLRAVYGATGRGDPAKARRVGSLARALSDHLDPDDRHRPERDAHQRLGELRQAATGRGVLERSWIAGRRSSAPSPSPSREMS